VSAGKQTVEIAPGFTAVLENKRLLVGKFDLSEADWRNGEFIFSDTPLNEVFMELGRQFNIKIKAQSHEGRIYTGRFSNKNLQEALQLICLPMGLTYRIENDSSVVIEDADPVK
jgi:ferric-dicitrate binding protein FerR (iron transport regulator)